MNVNTFPFSILNGKSVPIMEDGSCLGDVIDDRIMSKR